MQDLASKKFEFKLWICLSTAVTESVCAKKIAESTYVKTPPKTNKYVPIFWSTYKDYLCINILPRIKVYKVKFGDLVRFEGFLVLWITLWFQCTLLVKFSKFLAIVKLSSPKMSKVGEIYFTGSILNSMRRNQIKKRYFDWIRKWKMLIKTTFWSIFEYWDVFIQNQP